MKHHIKVWLRLDSNRGAYLSLLTQVILCPQSLIVTSIIRQCPCLWITLKAELSSLICDDKVLQLLLFREYITEAHTIIKDTEDDIQLSLQPFLLCQLHSQLVIMVAHIDFFSPWLAPRFVLCSSYKSHNTKVTIKTSIFQFHAQS